MGAERAKCRVDSHRGFSISKKPDDAETSAGAEREHFRANPGGPWPPETTPKTLTGAEREHFARKQPLQKQQLEKSSKKDTRKHLQKQKTQKKVPKTTRRKKLDRT